MLTSDARVIKEHFNLELLLSDLSPRYNIAPTQQIAAVIVDDGKRVLDSFRWGLIPHWAKDIAIGSKMINARAETVAEKPSYKNALARRRCLIPANGFYEWLRAGETPGPKRFELPSRDLFSIAGLWETWIDPSGTEIRSCTIITTGANQDVIAVHDRMPAILSRDDENRWLDSTATTPQLLSLINRKPTVQLVTADVSKKLNRAGYENPDLFHAV